MTSNTVLPVSIKFYKFVGNQSFSLKIFIFLLIRDYRMIYDSEYFVCRIEIDCFFECSPILDHSLMSTVFYFVQSFPLKIFDLLS